MSQTMRMQREASWDPLIIPTIKFSIIGGGLVWCAILAFASGTGWWTVLGVVCCWWAFVSFLKALFCFFNIS